MRDLTTMCMKQTYQRGNPTEPVCEDPKQEMDPITFTCYPKCETGYEGSGSMCWNGCPAGTQACGGAFCIDPNQQCTPEMSKEISEVITTIRTEGETKPGTYSAGTYFNDNTYPVCQ